MSDYSEFRRKMHEIGRLADEAHQMLESDRTPALEGIARMAMELRRVTDPEDLCETDSDNDEAVAGEFSGDPAATLRIPVEDDVPVVLDAVEQMYDEVQEEYEGSDDPSERTARQGSLAMELFAQLSNQGWSRYD